MSISCVRDGSRLLRQTEGLRHPTTKLWQGADRLAEHSLRGAIARSGYHRARSRVGGGNHGARQAEPARQGRRRSSRAIDPLCSQCAAPTPHCRGLQPTTRARCRCHAHNGFRLDCVARSETLGRDEFVGLCAARNSTASRPALALRPRRPVRRAGQRVTVLQQTRGGWLASKRGHASPVAVSTVDSLAAPAGTAVNDVAQWQGLGPNRRRILRSSGRPRRVRPAEQREELLPTRLGQTLPGHQEPNTAAGRYGVRHNHPP